MSYNGVERKMWRKGFQQIAGPRYCSITGAKVVCGHCGFSTTRKDNLKTHHKFRHPTEQFLFRVVDAADEVTEAVNGTEPNGNVGQTIQSISLNATLSSALL